MRILHIVGSMDPASGGICNGIRNSDAAMVKLGTTREVVCLDDPTCSYLGMDAFAVHALGPAKGPWQYSAKIKPWLIENLGRFDVFIINGLWIYPSYIGWKVTKYLKKNLNTPRVFVMPHGMLDPYFQIAPDRRLKAIRNWFYWKLIEKNILNDADAILFTCEKEMQLAHKTFRNYHPKKEINVGYGIAPPPKHNQDMYYAFIEKCKDVAFEPYLLFLSRIHEKKGVDLLIKAYASIAAKANSEKKSVPKLVIAGPGLNTAFGKKMVNLCNSFDHLRDLVFFPGMLTGDVKWGALYNCEAFVLPSHQENFGIAVVEAMACKKAVLISDQINIMTEINNGGGAIVAADTLEGTTFLLQKWLNLSPAQQNAMNRQALSTFKKYFDAKSAATFFLNAITG